MENEEEIHEGIFGSIQDTFQGLKGAFTGKGFGYFKFLSSLRNLVRKLKKIDEPNEKVIENLKKLRDKIEQAQGLESLEDEKRDRLTYAIDKAIESFRNYSRYVNTIEKVSTRALLGVRGNSRNTNTPPTISQTPPVVTPPLASSNLNAPPVTPQVTPPSPTPTPSSSSLLPPQYQNFMPENYKNKNKIMENIIHIKNLMK